MEEFLDSARLMVLLNVMRRAHPELLQVRVSRARYLCLCL